MGSDLRFDYSVLGDTVNLASRLEGQSKTYGVKTILGDATARAVKESFAVVELDLLQVKGKKEPEAVWTLLGDGKIRFDPDFKILESMHAEMIARYRSRDFEGAEEMMEMCGEGARRFGLGGFYEMFADRIALYRINPPPEGWTGVYTATSK